MAKKNSNPAQEEKKTNAGASSQTVKPSKPNMTIEKAPTVVYTPNTQTRAQTSQLTKATMPTLPNLTVHPPTSQPTQTKRSSTGVSGTVPTPGAKSSGAKNWTDRATDSVISYDQGGRVNAWQTALNVIDGLKSANTKALSNQKYSDRFNDDLMNEYKARGGKTIFGKATNADLYNQIEDELTPNYAPAQTSYERAQKEAEKAKKQAADNIYKSALAEAESYKATADDLRLRIIGAGGTPWTQPNALKSLGWGIRAGITQADHSIAKSIDWLAGDLIDDIHALAGTTVQGVVPDYDYGENYLDRYISAGNEHLAIQEENLAKSASDSKFAQNVGKYSRMIANSLPMSVMALATGGISGAAQATPKALEVASSLANSGKAMQYIKPIADAMTNMVKDPNWLATFTSVVGDSYEDALADGLSETGATAYAILEGAFNATTEVGGSDEMLGGLQKLPPKLKDALAKGDKSVVWQIIKSIPGEVGEEIVQGMGESGLKSFYKDVPIYSTDDDSAIINPKRMGEETLGAAVVTSVLGGGQAAISSGVNAIDKRAIEHAAKTIYGSNANELVERGLQSEESSKRRVLAEEYKAKIEKGKALTGKEIIELVRETPASELREVQAAAQSSEQTTTQTAETPTAPAPQNASESPVTNASAPTSTDTTTAQNSAQTPTTRAPAALGDMTAILNGNRVRVVGMTKMDNGQYAARIERATPQGTSQYDVTESKLTFDPETKSLLNMVRPYAYADEMLINYDAERNGGDKSLPAYVQAFNIVADILGKQSTLTEDEARAWVQNNKGLSATLSETQFEAAFRAGRDSKDAHVQNSATRLGGTGKLIFGKDVNYDGTQYKAATPDMISEAEREVLQTVAKAAGVDMFFYQSEAVDGKYQGANGFYRKGTVYLDVNAGANQTTEQSAVLLTAAHELTHYLRENNAEGYAELRDFVVTHLMQDGADIEAMAEKMIRREGIYDGSFTLDDAVEEIVADSCEMMLQNTQLPQIMAQENPSLYAKVKDWLRRFVDNLRRAFEGVEARSPEARAMMQYAGELQQLWDNALADTAAKPREKRGESGNAKFSVRKYDGNSIVWIDTDITKQKPSNVSMQDYVQQYISDMVSDRSDFLATLPESGIDVYAERKGRTPNSRYGLAEEYVRSTYSRWLKDNSKSTFRAKMKAAGVLDELVSIASGREWSETEHSHNKDAQYGVDTYRSSFAFPVKDNTGEIANVRAYDCKLVVLNASDGKKYLYDVIEIKENTSKAKDVLLSERQMAAYKAARQTGVVDSLSQSDAKVKTKYSNRERDTEYMEAVNAGDTETAQRLVDEAAADAGYSVHAYHGTKRADRVGTRFIPERSTSGPMAFFTSDPDIRYSRRTSDSEMTKEQTREQQMSRAELLRELEAQKQRTEYWRKQSQLTKEKTVRKTDTHKFARELAEQLDVKDAAAIAEFEDAAQYLGDYIVQSTSETMDYDTLHSIALDAADILLNNAEVEIESGMEEVRQDVFDYIKANKLKVNETEFKDMPEGWKRQHRRIRLSPDGVPIDVAWQQWQEQYGEGAFPSDITAQSDMLFYLADIEQTWRPYKGNPFAENMGEMREAVAQEIIDTMLSEEIRQTAPTAMDRAKAKADKRYSEMKQAERQRANDRIAKVLAEGKARTREAVKAERTFQLQRVERTQKTKSIEKLRDRMIKKLTDNTGKNHVPDILKEPVAQLLQSIDPTTTRTRQAGTAEYIKSLEKLQRVLENQRLHSQHNLDEDVKDATGADLYFDIPDGFAQQIQDYIEEVKHWGEFSKATTFKLEDMNLQELHDLENILKVVNGAVNRVNEMYTSSSTVSEISEGTIGYLDKMKPKTEATSGAEKFLGFTNQTPVYFFERMGETGAKIFKSFTDGWENFAFYTEEILNFTKALYSREEVRAAERDIRTVQLHNVDNESGLTNENTVPVQMTRAQIMNLYAATVRGEQSINHILGGGIKLTNIKDEHGLNNPKNLLNDPKDILKKSKDIVQPDTYHLNMQELSQIISDNLAARDKEIIDKMIKFLSGPIAQWGNAVSQKRWGIDLFTEENYWPIGTDRNSRPVSNMDSAGNSASIYHLANMGFTKPLTPGANNPMIIGSAFDVFANHTADMAKYGSLVLPMLDAMKWINYSAITETGTETVTLADGNEQTVERYSSKSVRKSMDRVYGHDAQDYFVRLMRDLNGSREGGRDAQNGLEKWTSRYKRQAVAANIRVMLLQPTSYIRAGNVLSLPGMTAGLNPLKVKQNYEEAITNSGIAKWKALGFYDTNTNASMRTQIKHDESTGEQIVDWTMKGAEMGDKWTWSMLWGASKREVESKAKRAGETLTHDELMQRTNDLFTEVIYKTQVVDSPLTRSQLMRSDDKLNRTLTSFMAEPTLTYNVLAENVNEWQREASANGRAAANKKCGGKILRNMMVYCAGSIVSAAVESVVDALRDDDEYVSFWDKYKEKFFGEDNFTDGNLWNELNPLSKLPIIKDVVGIVSGDSSSNMALEGFANAYSFIKSFNQKIKYLLGDPDAEDIKLTDWGLAYQGLRAISQLSGIPGTNATRDVIGIWNTLFAPSTGNYIHTYKQNPESNIKRAFLNGYVDEDEAMALLMDKETMGDKVYMSEKKVIETIDDWLDGGEKYEALYAALEDRDTKAYNEAFKALTDTGRYFYNVQNKVRNKIKELYQDGGTDGIRIGKEDAIKMMQEYGGCIEVDAKANVQKWTCKVVEGFDYNETKERFYSGDLTETEAVDVVYNYGNDGDSGGAHTFSSKETGYEEAREKVQEWKMLPETGIAFDDLRSAYNAHEITAKELKEYYIKYGSKTEEQAETYLYRLDWIAGDPALSAITAPTAQQYDTYVAGTGMSKRDYYSATKEINQFETLYDKNGEKIPNSKRAQIWEYIDSLSIPNTAKDALHLCYYAKSSLKDAPWNN